MDTSKLPTNLQYLDPMQALEAIKVCAAAGRSILLWGPPGVGKSSIVKQFARSLQYSLVDLRAALLDPVDLRGLPYVRDGISYWATPYFLPTNSKTVLLIDELNTAATLVMNAFLQLILDRRLGDWECPEGVPIIACCNDEACGATVQKMSSAMANRFIHIYVNVNYEVWDKWAINNQIHDLVRAFLKFRPNLLHDFDKHAKANPTPRSWEFVSDMLKQPIPDMIMLALMTGAVGPAGVEFMARFKMYQSLPDIDYIIANPTKAEVPHEPSLCYAVAVALGSHATPRNFGNICKYLARMSDEFNVVAVKDATQRDITIQSTPEFTTWMSQHAHLSF